MTILIIFYPSIYDELWGVAAGYKEDILLVQFVIAFKQRRIDDMTDLYYVTLFKHQQEFRPHSYYDYKDIVEVAQIREVIRYPSETDNEYFSRRRVWDLARLVATLKWDISSSEKELINLRKKLYEHRWKFKPPDKLIF